MKPGYQLIDISGNYVYDELEGYLQCETTFPAGLFNKFNQGKLNLVSGKIYQEGELILDLGVIPVRCVTPLDNHMITFKDADGTVSIRVESGTEVYITPLDVE